MSYGVWVVTNSGRDTFRTNYLGPIPDHITKQAMEYLSLSE